MEEKYVKRLEKRKKQREKRGRTVRRIRSTSIAVLVLAALFLGGVLAFNLFKDLSSRKKISVLQQRVEASTFDPGERFGGSKTEAEGEPASGKGMSPEAETGEAAEAGTQASGEKSQYEIRTIEAGIRLENYAALHAENPDFCGWLKIPDTEVDYPVMHRDGDNDFYLSHDFDGNSDVNGLLVLDKRCSADGNDSHLLIHGHNMKSGFMFGGLKRYKDEAYYREHPTIWYDSLTDERTYEIFAVFLSSVNTESTEDFDFYDYISIDDEARFEAYVNGARSASLYETGIVPRFGDRLITLSTCDYTKADGRLVIVGRAKR